MKAAAHQWPAPGGYKKGSRGVQSSSELMGAKHQRRLTHRQTEVLLRSSHRSLRSTMRHTDYQIVFISLCILHLSLCEGRPLRKRTVSEVQLMHNLGEHKQVQERRDWLQTMLRGIHTAADRGGSGGSSSSVEAGRPARRRHEDLPDLSPDEMEFALNFMEKLLKSQQS
ncbi:parathyroid hormone-like [Scophthalmus maximus]|uniref:parathyroid hormone-like n=1 Tax=Scophthalmus maximus TaxID=52904 RepID=UPI001FA83625|nr:parathyroid hormone-like [Scophthalmus maximus]